MSEAPVWDYVIKDMRKRNEEGRKKYNRYLMPNCPDNMLIHAYEEALDLAVYLKTQILKEQYTEEINKQLPLGLGDYT